MSKMDFNDAAKVMENAGALIKLLQKNGQDLVAKIEALTAERGRLAAENKGLREALSPSGKTKAAYHGEFHYEKEVMCYDEEGEEEYVTETIYTPWTTIKEIMAAILARATPEPQSTEGG